MIDAFLKVEGVQRRFGSFIAVDGVSLAVAQAEFHAVIGPNGAGKTTLFNLLTGGLKCQSGRIALGGRDITRLNAHRRARIGVGRTFQINNIFANSTVFENIQLAALAYRRRVWDMWRDRSSLLREEVEQAAAKVGLCDQLRKMATELSYGDRRKLELAIALATRPRLLLLDEPTCGMSASERPDVVELIRRLVDEDRVTAVLVEHDMDIVFRIVDRVTVMHRGKVIGSGTPADIKAHDEVRRVYLGEVAHA